MSSTPFAPDVVATLGGPKWLADRRAVAAQRFADRAKPAAADEAWRYGPIDSFELDRYAPRRLTDSDVVRSTFGDVVESPAAIVRTLDGAVVAIEVLDGEGYAISRITDAGDAGVLSGAVNEIDEAYVDLADALLIDGVVITVDDGASVTSPIVVMHEFSATDQPAVHTTRTVVRVGEGGAAVLVEHFVSSGGEILVLPVTEVDVAASGTFVHQIVQELAPSAWSFGYQASRVQSSGRFRSFAAALGGGYTRLLTRSSLLGELASSELLAGYIGTGNQIQHFVTEQEHVAPRTRSELVFKGAVADSAHSIYSGLVHMVKGAKKSEASQTNRNLVLGSDAEAFSVPNLDIEENDVRCSHASAVGPIDPDQIFYLESRGVRPEIAERLILLGFFDDLLERVVEQGSAKYVRAAVARALIGETFEETA